MRWARHTTGTGLLVVWLLTVSRAFAAPDAAEDCSGVVPAADRVRTVVVSHPYETDADGNPRKSDAYALWRLTVDGELAPTPRRFRMGRPASGATIRFTPQGDVAIVAQQGGTLGAVRMLADGPRVTHRAFRGPFYADAIGVHPTERRVYVLDARRAEVGGGIYEVLVDCGGSLSSRGRVLAATLATALAFVPGEPHRAVLAARDVEGGNSEHDLQLLNVAMGATTAFRRLGGTRVLDDTAATVGALTISIDGRYALVGDAGAFHTNGVVVVDIDGSSPARAQRLAPIRDPLALVASPYNDAALVISGYANAVFHLTYHGSRADPPFTEQGELTYASPSPALPAAAVMIERGALDGLVLIAEHRGVRRVFFEDDGSATDLGVVVGGEGTEAVVGTLGVQP